MTKLVHARWPLLALAALLVGCGAAPDDPPGEGEQAAANEEALAPNLLDDEELAFLSGLNQYRVDHGLAKLRVSIALTRASNAHSDDMAEHQKMQHDSSDGTDTGTRIAKYYPYNTSWGENIAVGYTTGAAVLEGWKNSPPHNAIMLSPDYKVLGISRVQAAADQPYYWTTDYGAYKDAILSAGFGTIASNGGFESSSITTKVKWSAVTTLNKWHTYAASGGSAARKTAAAAAGTYGLRSVDPSGGSVSTTELLRAKAGVNYGVSVQTRRIVGTTAQAVYLDFLNKDKKRIVAASVSTGLSKEWTTVSTSATSPAGTAYVRIILYGSGSGTTASTFDYDKVVVTAE